MVFPFCYLLSYILFQHLLVSPRVTLSLSSLLLTSLSLISLSFLVWDFPNHFTLVNLKSLACVLLTRPDIWPQKHKCCWSRPVPRFWNKIPIFDLIFLLSRGVPWKFKISHTLLNFFLFFSFFFSFFWAVPNSAPGQWYLFNTAFQTIFCVGFPLCISFLVSADYLSIRLSKTFGLSFRQFYAQPRFRGFATKIQSPVPCHGSEQRLFLYSSMVI